MNRQSRIALAATAALGLGMLMTACQSEDTSGAQSSSSSTPSTSSAASSADSAGTTSGSTQNTSTSTGTSGGGMGKSSTTGGSGSSKSGGSGSGKAGDKTGYGQSCGTNDIDWSAKSETQAGGYILIAATAKPGITCVLPVGHPTAAFGSGGIEAKNAEQDAGTEITLKKGVTAYAGVNPKTTGGNSGAEYSSIILSVGDNDPNPVNLKIGKTVVDSPIATNWHTSASQAVPFSD